MSVLSGIILGAIYLTLSIVYIASMRREEPEKEPEIVYSNSLHEMIVALYETDGQIQLVRDMIINIDTADAPSQGDALRSMDIYWDWCGRLEQQAEIPITKGTATAEAMRNLAEVRREELLRKLARQLVDLPRPEISGKQ
jgi:hypothetical protein